MPTIRELGEKREAAIGRMRDLNEHGTGPGGEMTADERRQYDENYAEQGRLKDQVDRLKRQDVLEAELRERIGPKTGGHDQPGTPEQRRQAVTATVEHRLGANRLLLRVPDATDRIHAARGLYLAQRALRDEDIRAIEQVTGFETRALQTDIDVSGGFLRPDSDFQVRLIQAVDNIAYIRQFATIYPLPSAETITIPSLDTDPSDPTWTSELSIGTADTAMALGRRNLTPHPLAKFIRVSNTLLRVTARLGPLNVEDLVRERFAYVFGITQEQAFMTGTGAGQPLGLFTAHANGIPTSRDVSTGNSTTAVGADNIRRNKYNLKVQYRMRPSTRWVINRTVVRDISLLKDGNGQYLWRPGLTGVDPDTIDGIRVLETEYAPNTMTTGLYVGLIGDMSFYWIAEALTFQIQVLRELYAATNETGFVGRLELDGSPVLAEAFSRMILA